MYATPVADAREDTLATDKDSIKHFFCCDDNKIALCGHDLTGVTQIIVKDDFYCAVCKDLAITTKFRCNKCKEN